MRPTSIPNTMTNTKQPHTSLRKTNSVLLLLSMSVLLVCTGCGEGTPPPTSEANTADIEKPPVAVDAYQITAGTDELATYKDTPVGFTDAGLPFRGDPNAPVMLVEYSDYLCPFCERHFQQTLPILLEEYVRTGKVKLVFRNLPVDALHPTAKKGAEAVLCVGEQGIVPYWKMHDALFAQRGEWNRLPDPGEFLAGIVGEIGADPAAYQACMTSGQQAKHITRDLAAAKELGFQGTPSFQFVRTEDGATHTLVGAQPLAVFSKWLDALLAGENPPDPKQAAPNPKQAELPIWARAEGLAPDPRRPGFTMAGDPYKGDPKAKLVVVEFSDFQCPSCGRHAIETQPLVDEEFVASGKVLWVFKNLPLRMHPHAAVAAAAAECAGNQGKFWEMDHLLFEQQEQWTTEEADSELTALASSLGLDMDSFKQCFNGRQAMQRVLDDLYDARGVTSSTPTFVFIYQGKGAVSRGAKEPEAFLKLVRDMVKVAATPAEDTTSAIGPAK